MNKRKVRFMFGYMISTTDGAAAQSSCCAHRSRESWRQDLRSWDSVKPSRQRQEYEPGAGTQMWAHSWPGNRVHRLSGDDRVFKVVFEFDIFYECILSLSSENLWQ